LPLDQLVLRHFYETHLHTYLTDTVKANVNGHKQKQIDDVLPWKYIK
jgi:hypothetical protein